MLRLCYSFFKIVTLLIPYEERAETGDIPKEKQVEKRSLEFT